MEINEVYQFITRLLAADNYRVPIFTYRHGFTNLYTQGVLKYVKMIFLFAKCSA